MRKTLHSGSQTAKMKMQYKCTSYLHEGDRHQREVKGTVGRSGLDPVADGIVGRGFRDIDHVKRSPGALKGWRASLEENSCGENGGSKSVSLHTTATNSSTIHKKNRITAAASTREHNLIAWLIERFTVAVHAGGRLSDVHDIHVEILGRTVFVQVNLLQLVVAAYVDRLQGTLHVHAFVSPSAGKSQQFEVKYLISLFFFKILRIASKRK